MSAVNNNTTAPSLNKPNVFYVGELEFNRGFVVARFHANGSLYAPYAGAIRLRRGDKDGVFYTRPIDVEDPSRGLVQVRTLTGEEQRAHRVRVKMAPTADPTEGESMRQMLEAATPGGSWGALHFGREPLSGRWRTTIMRLRSDWGIDHGFVGQVVPTIPVHDECLPYVSYYRSAYHIAQVGMTLLGGLGKEIPDLLSVVPGNLGAIRELDEYVEAEKLWRNSRRIQSRVRGVDPEHLQAFLQTLTREHSQSSRVSGGTGVSVE